MNKQEREKVVRREITLIVLVIVAAVSAFLLAQGVKHLAGRPADTAAGISYIRTAEASDISAIEKKIIQMEKQEMEKKRQEMKANDTRSCKEKFSGAVVMGDSITHGFSVYDVLNASSVVSKVGVHLTQLDEHIKAVSELQPRVIFMAYGMNDIVSANGDTETFVKHYKEVVEKVRGAVPGAHIYINSVFPVQKKALDKKPGLAETGKFNEALKVMCDELQIGFLDNTEFVKEEYYEADGVHFKASFYPIWAERMAEVADL